MKELIWSLSFLLRRVVGVAMVAIAYALWPSIPVLIIAVAIFVMSILIDIALYRWND